MKKVIILIFVTFSLPVSANVGLLEKAIRKSDISAVRSILPSTSISESGEKSLYALAKDILCQRLNKYKLHFLKFNSPLVLFEFSKREILTALGGLGLMGASPVIMALSLSLLQKYSYKSSSSNEQGTVDQNRNGSPSYLKIMSIAPGLILGASGTLTLIGTIIKHYWDVGKLYNNAIDIKNLLNK